MSLSHLARHLAEHGRHGDTMLMHVTPDEVGKLQRVARAQGGSLTVNPDTGLPEANFFSDLNPLNPNSAISKTGVAPLLVGAALGPGGFNLMSAANAGLLYGGISALSSGDLSKGLMAGLGAYGGAGLAAGLSNMGQASLLSNAGYTPEIAAGTPLSEASALTNNMSAVDKLGAGTSFAASNPKEALAALGGGSAWKGAGLLGAALSPVMAAKMVKTTTPPAQTQSLIRPYTYTARATTPTNMVGTQYRPGEDTSERNWMTGNFTAQTPYKAPGPEYGAEGGVVKMADGGVADLYGNLQRYAYNPASTQFDPSAGSVNYGKLPRYRFNPLTGRFELLPASVDASMPSDTSGAGYGGGDGGLSGSDTGTGSGGSTASSSSNSGTGSPTGSAIGDIGYAISNQSISPVAAAIASAMMDSMSSTSVTSSNATNGMDVASDAATAAGASTAAGADGPAGAGSTGMGSDTGGEGASAGVGTGGGAAGDSGAAGGGGGGAAGDGGSGGSGSSSGGDGGGGSSGGGGGDGGGGDARGGFYHNGQFDYHPHMAYGGLAMLANGGLGSLGGYSDGGRLLRGPGDGVSDSIPAQIGNKQPARLADGEFVVPARIVSELGNGSTEAGARQLYKMMDRVQNARGKTTGKEKVAKNTNAAKYLPA